MVAFVIGLAVAIPLLAFVSIALIHRSQRRTAVREAGDILELQIDERGVSLPHLAGEVDGIEVRLEKPPTDWVGLLEQLWSAIFDNPASKPTTSGPTRTYTASSGPYMVVVSPYGFPPEVEVTPSELRHYGPYEHDDNTLKVNFEDTFDLEAPDDEYVDAIIDNEDVMSELWAMHKRFQSIRCKSGEVHVYLEPMRTGQEIAGDIRWLVERAHDIGDVFEEHPIRV